MFPPTPLLGTLRLAKLADLPRIGVCAAAAFFHSSWFPYERPYYERFPLDTLSSYRNSFRKAILDPDSIVLVSEAQLDREEVRHVYGALANVYPSFDEQIPENQLRKGDAIVAVSSFSMLPTSARHGQFLPEGPNPRVPEDKLHERDKDKIAVDNMDKILHPREVEAFRGRMVIDMLVTHPAYWRQGHGSLITNWLLSLSAEDHVGLGVAGAPMGKLLFQSLGFEEVETVVIPGYQAHPKPIEAWLGVNDGPEKN